MKDMSNTQTLPAASGPTEPADALEAVNPKSLDKLLPALYAEEAQARANRKAGIPPGPITGIDSLDHELGGFLAPGIHAMLAAPGAGKTAISLQIAGNCGCPALYVTCEMRPVDLLRRIIAQTNHRELPDFRGGKLEDAEELEYEAEQAISKRPQVSIYDATDLDASTEPATVEESIKTAARGIKAKFHAHHVLLIVDSLTDFVAAVGTGDDERLSTERALSMFKRIFQALDCPIILIVHRHRHGQNAKNEEKLHSGKNSGRIEYISETVWDIEGEGKSSLKGIYPKRLTLWKNRNGRIEEPIHLNFEGITQTYTEV